MYDAWSAYDPRAAPTRASGIAKRPLRDTTKQDKVEAISQAAYKAVIDLFPADTAGASGMMASLGMDASDTSSDTTLPTGIGNVACKAVLDFRHRDGSNQLGDENGGAPYSDYTGYQPVNAPDAVNDPNRWQPLRVPDGKGGFVTQAFVTPQWSRVTPFDLELKVPATKGPGLYPSEEYAAGVDHTLRYSAELNDRKKTIAEYWADGPGTQQPPGHWSLFAKFVSQRDHHTIDQDVKLFFAQSNAILDASIMAWGIKRQYDSVRPVSAVHFLKSGIPVLAWGGPYQGAQWMDGGTWEPYQAATFVTPSFPEYVSGHSIFSAAGAEILKRCTGSDRFGASFTQPAGASVIEPGAVPAADVTLTWRTFTEAANEAGLSRRYGGIHFIPGDLDSRALGHELGAREWTVAETYWMGHPVLREGSEP